MPNKKKRKTIKNNYNIAIRAEFIQRMPLESLVSNRYTRINLLSMQIQRPREEASAAPITGGRHAMTGARKLRVRPVSARRTRYERARAHCTSPGNLRATLSRERSISSFTPRVLRQSNVPFTSPLPPFASFTHTHTVARRSDAPFAVSTGFHATAPVSGDVPVTEVRLKPALRWILDYGKCRGREGGSEEEEAVSGRVAWPAN
ncbi:hypothetical protein PUN28_002269 [Cardiocondyla obscurior]|uniref:Uncharacterized protein n=1 Tax=Cardiocondyla obscurior TaxID=286306 RepID=A0AAW2GTG9_9HYME